MCVHAALAVLYCILFSYPVFYRPINLIHETKDRWVYAIAFGALTGQFLYLILDGNILASAGPIGNIWRGTGLKLNVILILHYGNFLFVLI